MIKRMMRSSIATIALLVLGLALIGTGSVRGARAALREQTQREWIGQMELNHVYTELYEDGAPVGDAILADIAAMREAGTFAVGKTYDKELAVHNTRDVDEYVRVTVYRYWTDGEGNRVDLDPSLIDLGFAEGNWQEDAAASTPERTVLYYTPVLKGGKTTDPFVTSIAIKNDVLKKVTDGEYDYQGVQFHVDVVADAIQTHHAADAMNGVWGTAYPVSE